MLSVVCAVGYTMCGCVGAPETLWYVWAGRVRHGCSASVVTCVSHKSLVFCEMCDLCGKNISRVLSVWRVGQ